MGERLPQCKDIPTDQLIALIAKRSNSRVVNLRADIEYVWDLPLPRPVSLTELCWAFTTEFGIKGGVSEDLGAAPSNLVRAKLDRLVRRRLVDGCACGCRGDFMIRSEET